MSTIRQVQSNAKFIECMLDEVITKLDNITSCKTEMENMKNVLTTQLTSQAEAVQRLAGNSEYLLNSQKEVEVKLSNLDNNTSTLIYKLDKINGAIESSLSTLGRLGTERIINTPGQMKIAELHSGSSEQKESDNAETAALSVMRENTEVSISTDHAVKESDENVIIKSTSASTNGVRRRFICRYCNLMFPYSGNDIFIRCWNVACKEWNAVAKLDPGHHWIAFADPCGHIQQVPVGNKVGDHWRCEECGSQEKIDHEFQVKESEEIINCLNGMRVPSDQDLICGKCLQPIEGGGSAGYKACIPCCVLYNPTLLKSLPKPPCRSTIVYKCFQCSRDLSNTRHTDGVSIQCDNDLCRTINCAGRLKSGYKWVRLVCGIEQLQLRCDHIQQVPLDVPTTTKLRCRCCSSIGYIKEVENVANVEYIPRMDDARLVYKCRNCYALLPTPRGKDKTKTSCRGCKHVNVVGVLDDGRSWIFLTPCMHYQQSELYHFAGEMITCKVCRTIGRINDAKEECIPFCEKIENGFKGNDGVVKCVKCNTNAPITFLKNSGEHDCKKCGQTIRMTNFDDRISTCSDCNRHSPFPECFKKMPSRGTCKLCNKFTEVYDICVSSSVLDKARSNVLSLYNTL